MKPFSSLHLRVFVAVLAVFAVAIAGFFFWKRSRTPQDNYRDMVSAFYTGVIALQVGDPDHVVPGLTTATVLYPSEPAPWANLGLYALRQGQWDQARQSLTKARDLAPKNAQIAALFGLLAEKQNQYPEAIAAYRQVVKLDPSDLRARYALEQVLEQQSGPGGDPETLAQLQAISDAAPDNLFAALSLAIPTVKAGRAAQARALGARLAAQSASWPADAKQSLAEAQKALAGSDPRGAAIPLQVVQNLLSQFPAYKSGLLAIAGDRTIVGTPLTRFLTLPSPAPTPAPPDTALTLPAQPLTTAAPGVWAWAQTAALTPEAAPILLVANGKEIRAGGVSLPFLGGPKASAPGPDGALVFDANNDFASDLACAGAGGFRLYAQGKDGKFSDVTGASKLPPAVTNGAYSGVWASDIDTDGDLDLILGTAIGPPTVLRNNGDGTWTVLHPFGPAKSGLTQWVWADLDGDGSPDAAFLDGQGRLTVLQNRRSGVFSPWPVPADLGKVAALSAADPDRDGTQDLVVLMGDGTVRQLSRRAEREGWDTTNIGQAAAPPTDGSARLRWADLDNNGALDLIATSASSSQVLLGDAGGKLIPLAAPAPARNVSIAGQAVKGRLDLIGLDAQGRPVRLTNTGTKDYGWHEVRLRADTNPGDNRNNTYGVGGEIGLRAGLLYETQIISGPVVHFGLGTYAQADYIRIVWPNGSPQGEFGLKSGQLVAVTERLKGSCPWLLADDGSGATANMGMKFVTDFIWRSPLGLRINAQDTAGVVQTRDWVKVRGDQLKARDGFYNLRITADLWETHFFDEVKLMTVDHPAGVEANVDERFAIPPPPLAVQAMTPPVPAARAVDDTGTDVTDTIRARDGRYLDTFGRGMYQGVTRDHWVTLDLGPQLAGPNWLVGVGWIHPTDSSINVALGQGQHIPPHDLTLEVPDGAGGWRVARAHLGFPEGKFKTVLLPLGGLFSPRQPRQVRLRTNMEIYWDFLGTAQARPSTLLHTRMLAPATAALRYRGFSATHQANRSSPEVPDYQHLSGTAPQWLDLDGYCTRFGDVRPLLTQTDDRYVIMNAGDEMVLRFAAPPPPPPGWTRDFALVGDGWEKDGDFNTGFSRTVLPLPSHSRPAYNTPPGRLEDDPVYKAHRQDWVTYQTRWVSSRRFHEALRP